MHLHSTELPDCRLNYSLRPLRVARRPSPFASWDIIH